MVEMDGFEPPRFLGDRFTVCCNQPLCHISILKHTTGTPQQSQDRLLLLPFRHYSSALFHRVILGFPLNFRVHDSEPARQLDILSIMHLAVLSTSNTF